MLRDYTLPFLAAVESSGNVELLTPAERHAARKKT